MPSSLRGGGFGELAVLGGFGVKNDPKKSFGMCLEVLGRTMFPDGFDAFWAL